MILGYKLLHIPRKLKKFSIRRHQNTPFYIRQLIKISGRSKKCSAEPLPLPRPISSEEGIPPATPYLLGAA